MRLFLDQTSYIFVWKCRWPLVPIYKEDKVEKTVFDEQIWVKYTFLKSEVDFKDTEISYNCPSKLIFSLKPIFALEKSQYFL